MLHWIAMGAREAHRAGAWGAFAWFGIVYALMLLLFPTVPLIIASGWLFGIFGAVIALAAAVAAAASAFALAGGLGRSDAARALREHPKARALSDLAEEGGAWTVALLRLAPILPFTPTNAVLGLTGMRLRDLALGTFLGMAPGALLYAWAGSLVPSAEALEEGESLVPGPLVWGLLAASIVAAVVIGIAAARRLRRATPEGRPPR
ncbi:MAG: TVP38/TMEM64 family protein [Deltaproteobacteria bacterium]|nr:MAG: TVP38/TMEM64 family protein [Deltaproteobacteria bacterium]TMB31527.1 MAG: TVP38/TMEM64 family protein [Deltaproteobacteria bacterium]